jgi:hypothetical protein
MEDDGTEYLKCLRPLAEKDITHEWSLRAMEERGMGSSVAFTALNMAGPNPTKEEADFWNNWKEEMKMKD